MKKRILFFIESLSGGGAEQVLITLLRHLDYSHFEVGLMTVADVGIHLADVDYSRVNYNTLIPHSGGFLKKLWYKLKYKLIYHYLPTSLVAKLIIPRGYDTYVAFVEGYCTKIIARLPKKVRKVAWVHTDLKDNPWTIEKRIYNCLEEEKVSYVQYNAVVCVSRSVEETMSTYYNLNNCQVIYNPLDTDKIRELSAIGTEDMKLAAGFNIITVGRLVPQKGYDLLIPIIARLRAAGLDVSLYILGDGECRKMLENQIIELDLCKYVHLLGYRPNPYALMRQMNLFVCSSRAEGFSLVIAEALALGVPVVSTLCSGPNELLGNNQYGMLCPDHEELYQTISNIVRDATLYADLKRRAEIRQDMADISRIIRQVESVL